MNFQITDNIRIKAEYYETRYSWGHKAWLYFDGQEVDYKKITYYNRTWESYQFQSIVHNLIDKSCSIAKDKKQEYKAIADEIGSGKVRKDLKNIGMIAKLGSIFGATQKESNDWKTRMLIAGLADKGLIMPEDWDTLGEDEKERRLDAVIAHLAKKD